MGKEKLQNEDGICWHPAFVEAIQLELDEYSRDLQFIPEHPLNTEPLRIDVVIIKKSKDVPIGKNIASIFRKENIIEYKSPEDYVSVEDFYKVYGYACLYQSLNKADIRELTISFVESRYPRELLSHLHEERGYTVEEKQPGIYLVKGDILPIQVIDSRKLSEDENIWLRDLSNKLDMPELQRIAAEIRRQGKANVARLKAYLDAITRANLKSLREVMRMSDSVLTLDEIFEEAGLIAKWEARGIAEGHAEKTLEIARKMKAMGDSVEKIQAITGLAKETIEAMSNEQ
jgi:hypothetical protein